MKVQVLLSTCNQKSIQDLHLNEKNIKNCIIINQFAEKYEEEKQKNYTMYSYAEKGIARSRNHLIEHATSDIGIITDDDVTFVKDYDQIIERAYEEHPEADVIIFNVKMGDRLIGSSNYKKYNKISIMSVSSIQISFRLDSIRKKNIKFDERFGLGSIYKAGEENIFLNDCLKNGLQIIHIPFVVNEHPDVATTGEKWDENLVKAKGAFSYRILKHAHILFLIYFAFFKHKNYKDNLSMIKFIRVYYRGLKEFKETI